MYQIMIETICGIQPREEDIREVVRLLRGQGFNYSFKSICPVCHRMPLSNAVLIDGHEYHQKCFKIKEEKEK